MQEMFLIMLVLTTTLFIMLVNPLIMSITVIMQTITMTFILYLEKMNPWFSYLLFMIFMSGMMIIFLYIASLASNEPISYSDMKTITKLVMILTIFTILSLYFMDKILHQEIQSTTMLIIANEIYKPYQMILNNMTLFMIIYLFVVLIITINISKKSKMSMRAKK